MDQRGRSQHPQPCEQIRRLPTRNSRPCDTHLVEELQSLGDSFGGDHRHPSHAAPLLRDAEDSPNETDQVAEMDSIETCSVPRQQLDSISHRSTDTSKSKSQERPKIVSSLGRRNALVLIALTHIPPVLITLVLLSFYIVELRWPPPGPSDNVRSAIQFAAKIHEGLIAVSLAQLLLHGFRYELMNINGVPFGYLAVPYQLGSASSLFSKAFWSAVTTCTAYSSRRVCTALLIILCAALAIVCGPASAVVMLPRVGWWPVSSTLLTDVYANASYVQLIPQTLNASELFLDNCKGAPIASYPASCPYGGWQSLYKSLIKIMESKQLSPGIIFPDSDEEIFETSVPSMNGTRPIFGRATSTQNDQSQFDSLAYSITPPDFLTAVLNLGASRMRESHPILGFRLQPSSPNDDGILSWKQPFVLTQCHQRFLSFYPNGTIFDGHGGDGMQNFTVPFNFTTPSSHPFQITLNDTWLRPIYNQYLTNPNAPPVLSFLNIQSTIPFPVSAVSVMVNYVFTEGNKVEAVLQLCTINASWVPFSSSSIELLGNRSSLSVTQPAPNQTWSQLANTAASHTPLTIDANWLRTLNASVWNPDPKDANINTSQVGFLNMLSALCGTDMTTAASASCGALSVALLVADGVARWADSLDYLWVSAVNGSSPNLRSEAWAPLAVMDKEELQDVNRFTKISIVAFEQSAGYRFNDFTVIIAMVILLLHVVLVLGHVCIIFIGRPWTSNAWSGLGELLALAVRSTPTDLLMNTGAGVDKGATWKLRTYVREVQDKGQLSLVFRDELLTGHREEKTDDLYILPRPDCRYR